MPTNTLATLALIFSGSVAAADVNIYTSRQPELIEPVFDAFTDKTGISVNFAYLEKGIAERLLAEGRRSPADLVLTTDISNLRQIVDAGVVQPVTSNILTENIPAHLRSADDLWFGLTVRARVIYASRDRVADGAVTTYEDLASPKWSGRICSRSGLHSYNLALLAAVAAHDGKEAATNWAAGIKANLARKPQGNDRAQVKAIWAGECDISLGNTYYMGLMLRDKEQKAWADSVRIIFPQFENGGTHVNVSGMALTKAAPNREQAIRLMEFLVSPQAQAIYAELNHEYPVNSEAPLSDLVSAWGEFDADSISLDALAERRAEAVAIMHAVDFDD